MIRYLSYYCKLVKANIILKMTYRLNFWFGCISDVIMYSVQIAVFKVVYFNVDNINGWSMNQIIFFLGAFFLIDSIAMVTFFLGIISIPDKIRTGELDLYLVKPINPLFNIMSNKFEISFLPNILYGIILMIYSGIRMNINMNLGQLLSFFVILFLMYVLYITLMTIAYSSAFWFVRVSSITELHHELVDMSYRVPGVAFSGIWKKIFMFVLPYGLIATVPTQVFTDWKGFETIIIPIGIVIAFCAILVFVWKKGLEQYDSASS